MTEGGIMEPFELFAIRYANQGGRVRAQNISGGDLHEAHSDLDFYVWIAKRSDRVFMIDTGMSAETAKRKGETSFRVPADALKLLGLSASNIEDVILTHLHYDHAGTLDRYTNARFHIQESEMQYATGRCMCNGYLRRSFSIDDVVHLVRCVHNERVVFHENDVEITPGLTLHRVGGHSGGLQIVRVWTKRGWVVLASDASHLYYNMMRCQPYPSITNAKEMVDGFRTINRLADGNWDRAIPGHDPLVMKIYPPVSVDLEGIVARLDVPPLMAVPL